MTRLPLSGGSITSPYQSKEALKPVLCKLCGDEDLDPDFIDETYTRLGRVIGEWMSEQERLEVSSVAGSLLSTAKNLDEAALFLSGFETGIHSGLEIEVGRRIARCLALEAELGSVAEAQNIISSFRREAIRIARVCMAARADLPNHREASGRRPLRWYDDFTALLFGLADRAGVEPALRKDRVTGVRGGWLFEAAQALEPFLWPEMRSRSAEACGSRLDRSKRRLRARHRQNKRAG
jgi:hypothetical protein